VSDFKIRDRTRIRGSELKPLAVIKQRLEPSLTQEAKAGAFAYENLKPQISQISQIREGGRRVSVIDFFVQEEFLQR
jgi:hypothetical protein